MGINPVCRCYSVLRDRFDLLLIYGGVAQLGERLPCTQEAIGSIPFTSTIFYVLMSVFMFCEARHQDVSLVVVTLIFDN